MEKFLNFLIGLLGFLVLAALVLVIMFSFMGYDVSIKLNGATSVDKEEMKCHMTLLGCYLKTPNAVRNDGTVVGYSYAANDNTTSIKVGDRIKIEEETDLYVISYKTFSAHIEKGNVDYLEKEDVSCNAYNTDTSCKVKLPDFNKVGYVNAGYSKSQKLPDLTPSEYYPFVETNLEEDLVLYPIYSDVRDDDVKVAYNNSNVYSINGTFIEFDSGLSQNIIDKYKKFLDEISKKAPYLFVGEKINILQQKTFQKAWQPLASAGGIILGICYSNSMMGYPLSRGIDVFYFSNYNDVENYRTLVHEMSHAFDMYYGYAIDEKMPDIISYAEAAKLNVNFQTLLNKLYGTKRISAQSDIMKYYNEYRNMKNNRPIDHQGYAYTKDLEFVAEAFSWYYMQFVLEEPSYKNSPFPDDFKKTLEKYICIANNGYNKTGC